MRNAISALVCAALLVTPAVAQNLLTNANFDTGSLSPWTTFQVAGGNGSINFGAPAVADAGGVWTPDAPTSGAFVLKKSYGGNIAGGDYGAYQQVSVTAGHLHVLTGDVAGGVGGFANFNGTATWEVRVLDGPWNLSQVNGGLLAFGRTQTNEIGFPWTHFNFGFTPTTSTVTVVLHYTALDPQWDYSFFGAYYDSLTLTDATTTCANPSNISGANPNALSTPPDPGVQNITFSGSNLDLVGAVSLQHESGSPTLSGAIQSQVANQIVAQFNFTGAPAGYYTATGTRQAPCSNAALSQAVQIACGVPSTSMTSVSNDRGKSGTMHTILLMGTNVTSLSGVKLHKTRDGGAEINGTLSPSGSDLQVTFDLTNAEGGFYDVIGTHPCGLVNPLDGLKKAFLVYMPVLTNAGFEQGFLPDTSPPLCQPGYSGANPKARHWDLFRGAGYQGTSRRDGNVGGPNCVNNRVQNGSGDHYGGFDANVFGCGNPDCPSLPSFRSFFQTIDASPLLTSGMTTHEFNVRAELDFNDLNGGCLAMIRLIDGAPQDGDDQNVAGSGLNSRVVGYAELPSTGSNGLLTDPAYNAVISAGTLWHSNPPILTIEFRLYMPISGLLGFWLDNVRTGPYAPPGCNPVIWADADGDSDVDMDDFGIFQRCYSGSTGTIPTIPQYPCTCFDRSQSAPAHIDDFDFNKFKDCVSGSHVPWSMTVTPNCQP